MSINFWLDTERKNELLDSFECLCIDNPETSRPHPDCFECKGTGLVEFYGDPRDINMSNGNACRVLDALGIEIDYCGEIDGTEFYQRLRHEGQFIAIHRYSELFMLAREANQLGVKVLWG